MDEVIIKFEDVEYNYEGEDKALDGMNIEISKGEFIAVIGHNGSGKSTLAKCINALLLPSNGRVVVFGMDTREEEHVISIRSRAGMVFQNPDNQMVTSIVEDDIAFGPENLGVDPAEIRIRVDDALKAVDMSEYAQHTPYRLSGGQKQRIAIAGILSMQPEVIILDESTAMLDPKGRREVLGIVNKLNKEEGITIVLITHEMDEIAYADKVIVLNDGMCVMKGTPDEVFANSEELKKYALMPPFATKLALELKSQGMNLNIGANLKELADEVVALIGDR